MTLLSRLPLLRLMFTAGSRLPMSRPEANAMLLVAAVCWGSGNVAQKTVLDELGPLTAIAFRCLIAAAAIWPLTRREVLPGGAGPSLRLLVPVVVLFALAVAIMQIGYGGTTVTNAGFMVNTTTVMTPIAAWLLLREAPSWMVAPAIALTLPGILLMGGGSLDALTWGDGLCLAAALIYSVWIVLLGRLMQKAGRPMWTSMLQFASTGIACGCLALMFEPVSMPAIISSLPELVFLGFIATAIPYAIQATAQQYTSSSAAAILMSAEALFGAIGAAVLLGESLGLTGAIGAVLIAGGILVVQIDTKGPGG